MLSYKQYLKEDNYEFREIVPAAARARYQQYGGTAIEHRGNRSHYGDGGPEVLDARIRHMLKNPSTNPMYRIVKSIQPHATFAPDVTESSLGKQYAIAHAFSVAATKHPAYEKAVYEGYQKHRGDVLDQLKARDYGELVKHSYKQMEAETEHQFNHLPVKLQYHSGAGSYQHSGEMLRDYYGHGNLTVFKDSGNPHEFLNKIHSEHGVNSNEMFRAVHDAYGHTIHGNSFGPKGEEVAWDSHRKVYSPGAQVAMTAETRMQNSWVNFSGANTRLTEMMEHERKQRKEALAFGDVQKANHHDELLRHMGQKWNYASQVAVAPPHEFLNPKYDGHLPESMRGLTNHRSEPYDARVDPAGFKKLSVLHNTGTHMNNNGGQFNPESARSDLEHIAKIHGYSGIR